MKNTLLFLAVIVSLFYSDSAAHAGGDAPKPLGSDVLWYKDTLGTSPFKTKFIGMWFSPDGKTIAVPQGRQLFLVSSETGDVSEKIDVGFYIKSYSAANDRFLLSNDTSIFIYDKYTYKLIKRIELPQNLILNQYPARHVNALSPDGKTIITAYYQKSKTITYYPEVGIINVEGGNYKKIKDGNEFQGFYSPDGNYFIAYETETYGQGEPYRVAIYNAKLTQRLYDTWGWVNGNASNFSFSADSKLLYFSNANTMYSVDMANGFKVKPMEIEGSDISKIIPINDTLFYSYCSTKIGGYPTTGLMNAKSLAFLYKYTYEFMGTWGFISPQKDFMIQYGFNYIFKVPIPYDKLTKTDEEIKKINNDFTLSPNPTYDQVNFSLYLMQDQELSYAINTMDGKTVKIEYLGKYGAGQVSGIINLKELNAGNYILVLSDGANKLASGKISVLK